jgi:4-amino-4-deoxy-L-arabinose transferase-like glycosyltransferase
LGVAMLAKGLVPMALAIPAVWMLRRRWRGLAVAAAACVAVAGPWYVACWWVNGQAFVDEFFWRHHFQRATSDALQHVQPWWYYGPVLLGGMFPWTPLVGLGWWRKIREDSRLKLFAFWVGFGVLFFSAAPNKLPGYLLPLMPAVFALIGVRLADASTRARWLPACAALAGLIPVAGWALPVSLTDGLSTVQLKDAPWGYIGIGFVLQSAVWGVGRRWGRGGAFGLTAIAAVGCVVYLKAAVLPVLDEKVSARGLWRRIEERKHEVCIGDIGRDFKYGLNYYSINPLPLCSNSDRPLELTGHGQPKVNNRGEAAP